MGSPVESGNKELVVTFIDFRKASDYSYGTALIKVLQELGPDRKTTDLIRPSNKHPIQFNLMVKFNGEIFQPFKITTGVEQDDALSHLLLLNASLRRSSAEREINFCKVVISLKVLNPRERQLKSILFDFWKIT